MTDCLEISLLARPSGIKAGDGRQIPFTRAVLSIRNACGQEVAIEPHATLGQEGGTLQDVSAALLSPHSTSVPAFGTASWDVYDVLLSAHQGAASKVHMFGYRAVLNWTFHLAVWADYRAGGSPAPLRTKAGRWTFRWSIADTATGAVGLTIEELKG